MDITIRINTDNASFEDAPAQTLRQTLRQAENNLAESWDGEAHSIPITDVNGNTVGTAEITALETVKELPEPSRSDETVDLVASGYEWECPTCLSDNTEDEVAETVTCIECNTTFDVGEANHAVG